MNYEIYVSNIGLVLETADEAEARDTYAEYVSASESEYGRASGESVTLMVDGEPLQEYFGSLTEEN